MKKAQLYSIFKNSAYYFYEFDRFDHDNVISVNMYGYLSIKNKENDTPKQIIRRLGFPSIKSKETLKSLLDLPELLSLSGKNTVTSLSPLKGYTSKKTICEALKMLKKSWMSRMSRSVNMNKRLLKRKKEIELKKLSLKLWRNKLLKKERRI